MFQGIFAFIASLVTFGAGLAGMGGQQNPQEASINQYGITACYQPETNVTLTLTWPNDFINISDPRSQLNSDIFPASQFPLSFNSDETTCRPLVMNNPRGQEVNPRTYIRVRQNIRISSCKTDELAGPFTVDQQQCTDSQIAAAKTMRGSCDVSGVYPDLRKVAEVRAGGGGGSIAEVFWTPYTHNVGCAFNPDQPNCGKGDGTNMNMREFIYVLKNRQGYDPANIEDCKVRWDERYQHNNPCSHYFDVYMAQDLYEVMQTIPANYVPVPTTDPAYDPYLQNYWLFKQRMENCQEQNTFSPVVYPPTFYFPPEFIEKPFLSSNFAQVPPGKIQPAPTELENYCRFTNYSGVNLINNSLYKINELSIGDALLPQFTTCPPEPPAPDPNSCPVVNQIGAETPRPSCFAPIGNLTLPDTSNRQITFKIYANWLKPANFYLKDTQGIYPKIYEYINTSSRPPGINRHESTLQLAHLEFMNAAEWTWATPICKPAIYLYPQKTSDLTVRLELDGKLTVSDPLYENDGWSVRAKPDGTLTMLSGHSASKKVPYLYYEADIKGLKLPDEGFVFAKEDLEKELTTLLTQLGFNRRETEDFLSYWLPRLRIKPYYFVTLLPREIIESKEKLIISESPDTIIRERFIFEGIDFPFNVKSLKIEERIRKGFVLADWGGSLIGENCEITNVK